MLNYTNHLTAGQEAISLWNYGLGHYYLQWQNWDFDTEPGAYQPAFFASPFSVGLKPKSVALAVQSLKR